MNGFSVDISDALICLAIVVAACVVLATRSRLTAVAALGVVGYCISLFYVFYGAPDLALTQAAIETLSVILFVLVVYRLPRLNRLSARATRMRDALIAVTGGIIITTFMLLILDQPFHSHLATYYSTQSLLAANGRNIVNVILVDFRALDTLGEITVLGIAALGVTALLKSRKGQP